MPHKNTTMESPELVNVMAAMLRAMAKTHVLATTAAHSVNKDELRAAIQASADEVTAAYNMLLKYIGEQQKTREDFSILNLEEWEKQLGLPSRK